MGIFDSVDPVSVVLIKTKIPNQFALITTCAVAKKAVRLKTMCIVEKVAFKIQTNLKSSEIFCTIFLNLGLVSIFLS